MFKDTRPLQFFSTRRLHYIPQGDYYTFSLPRRHLHSFKSRKQLQFFQGDNNTFFKETITLFFLRRILHLFFKENITLFFQEEHFTFFKDNITLFFNETIRLFSRRLAHFFFMETIILFPNGGTLFFQIFTLFSKHTYFSQALLQFFQMYRVLFQVAYHTFPGNNSYFRQTTDHILSNIDRCFFQ